MPTMAPVDSFDFLRAQADRSYESSTLSDDAVRSVEAPYVRQSNASVFLTLIEENAPAMPLVAVSTTTLASWYCGLMLSSSAPDSEADPCTERPPSAFSSIVRVCWFCEKSPAITIGTDPSVIACESTNLVSDQDSLECGESLNSVRGGDDPPAWPRTVGSRCRLSGRIA